MAAKIHFEHSLLFCESDIVVFFVDPSLFIVNKKAPFSCSCFYPEMDKLLTDTDRNDFVKWTLIALF